MSEMVALAVVAVASCTYHFLFNELSKDAAGCAGTESPAHALAVWRRAGTWEEQTRDVD